MILIVYFFSFACDCRCQRIRNFRNKMNDERLRTQGNSNKTSRLSNYSGRHFDFLDTHHSVFSRNSYYHDMQSVHPWARRSCSPFSGIPSAALRTKPCSTRLEDLARPKIKREPHIRQEYFDNITNYLYSGVKPTALTAQCSDRLAVLAQPKKIPKGYIPPKVEPEQAVHWQTSDQSRDLPKSRHNTIIHNSLWKNKQK